MPATHLRDRASTRHTLRAGVETLAQAVQVTLGPTGRHVGLEKPWGAPSLTNDGVTVAQERAREDRVANMGVPMGREVAAQPSEVAGEGTTTATVLAAAISSLTRRSP